VRADRCPFYAVVHAQQVDVRRGVPKAGRLHNGAKPAAQIATLIRKAGEGEPKPGDGHCHGGRLVKDVNARVGQNQVRRQPPTLVVARDDDHVSAGLGRGVQRLQRLVDDRRRNPWLVKQIAAVHDHVHLARQRRLHRTVVVLQKIRPPWPPLHARTHRQVQADVRVGDQQKSNH